MTFLTIFQEGVAELQANFFGSWIFNDMRLNWLYWPFLKKGWRSSRTFFFWLMNLLMIGDQSDVLDHFWRRGGGAPGQFFLAQIFNEMRLKWLSWPFVKKGWWTFRTIFFGSWIFNEMRLNWLFWPFLKRGWRSSRTISFGSWIFNDTRQKWGSWPFL